MEFTTTTQQKNEISLFLHFSNQVTSTRKIRQQMSTQTKNLNNTTLVIFLKCTDQLHLSINPGKGHRLQTSVTSQYQKCEPQVVHHPSPPTDNDEDHRLYTSVTSLPLDPQQQKKENKMTSPIILIVNIYCFQLVPYIFFYFIAVYDSGTIQMGFCPCMEAVCLCGELFLAVSETALPISFEMAYLHSVLVSTIFYSPNFFCLVLTLIVIKTTLASTP